MTVTTTISADHNDRSSFQDCYRADETTIVTQLATHAQIDGRHQTRIKTHATELITLIRAEDSRGGWQLNHLLHDYDLSTEEGIALMCLAEALLRVPDTDTANHLIADKLDSADWASHASLTRPLFINAAAWGLVLGKQIVAGEVDPKHWYESHHKLISRLNTAALRAALRAAMKALGELFIFGETIEAATRQYSQETRALEYYSFDMLGEAACTNRQADHFLEQYLHTIEHLAGSDTKLPGPAISVKLSALHPTYQPLKRQCVVRDIYPKLLTLCKAAMSANISLCLDAEESDRLELSLDLLEKLLNEPSLKHWDGLGVAVQAYQKRAYPLLRWLVEQANKAGRKLQVRLVKGAYWDSEIKVCQALGLSDFPVFTRKVNTDISYLACTRFLLDQRDTIYPQFATHNAHTLASIMEMSGADHSGFEVQRLHGMGDIAHHRISRDFDVPSRIYAPIGAHSRLLPYLVRRLLENGANSSFVSQVARSDQTIEAMTKDPVTVFKTLAEVENPHIANPAHLFMPQRANSAGVDFSDRERVKTLYQDMTEACSIWLPMAAHPMIAGLPASSADNGDRPTSSVINPADLQDRLGEVSQTTALEALHALQQAHKFAPQWAATSPAERAALLCRVADLLQADKPALMALCVREAGKTLVDAEAEVREAIDFCHYYAAWAEALIQPRSLPSCVGEHNDLSWRARGPFLCISPWNFPLAILCGQAMAALVSGNPVLLKPAQQTSLTATMATQLFYRAGIPAQALQLLPGDGPTIARVLLPQAALKGVAFTGSFATARNIHQKLARRQDEIIPLIAETGGQNAMIVDSSALPEQVVRDVLVSAFGSAGQRCSCLRILFLQEDIADHLITLLKDAMSLLEVGDPWQLSTDIGPVISAQAARQLKAHIEQMRTTARAVHSAPLSQELAHDPASGYFVSPTLIELGHSTQLQGEVFGPILHVVSYSANQIDALIETINATGFGLSLGIHSRIETFTRYVAERVKVGNIYINRHMTGAVVGSQPFGGQGRSGTGFKAGGPHYLYKFMTEKCISVDTTAAGGNASLLSEN